MSPVLLLYLIIAGLVALLLGELNWYWILATVVGLVVALLL